MEIKEPEILHEEADELTSQPSEDLEELLKNLNNESDSTKLRTEELYKEYLEKYNKKLQIGRIHIIVNKALKDIQSIDDLIIEDNLEEKDLEKLTKNVDIVNKYLKNNSDVENYEMIKMLLDQATAILELEKMLKETNIDDVTKSSLNNLLDNIVSKDLKDKYEERINGIIDYNDEDEIGAEELESEMNKSEELGENNEEIEPELLNDGEENTDEEVSTNKERYIKMPKSKLKRFEGFWKGRFGLLIETIEELESLVKNKNTSIEELKSLYDKANEIYSKRAIQKESLKVKKSLKERLDKINRQIESRIKEEQVAKEAEEKLKENQDEKLRKEQEDILRKQQEEILKQEQEKTSKKEQEEIQKQKSQFEKIMQNAKEKPNLQNIEAAKAYIEKYKDNKNLFENEEIAKNYIQQLDRLYENNIVKSVKTKIEEMKKNPSYANITIAKQSIDANEEILKKNNLYDTYLDVGNDSMLEYISNEISKLKKESDIQKIDKLKQLILNHRDKFKNETALNECISNLDNIKKQLLEKGEATRKAANILETIKLTVDKAKGNPTKENIDTAKNLIRSYMYESQIFSSSIEATNLLNELEELSKQTFKQVTEGPSTKYSDLNKFIANKEVQINKLRDREQELRGKLIDLERQDFIHPELKLERMAPIKRELASIQEDIKYYDLQLTNAKKVLENRRHASVQEHYESLFNGDLASLSNEEIQKASSEKIDMDELKKYAQLKEKLNPVKVESITKKDVGELAADNFNASLSSAMSMRLTDVDNAERMIEDAEKVFWANRSNYPQDRLEELQNNLEIAISTIKNQKYQNTDGKTL